MYEKLKQQVLPQLIAPGSRILAAVSGGPDSVALAHILWRYIQDRQEQKITLVITHVHHGVREESDDEEKMVQNMARDWEIPCLIHRFDSKNYAKSVGKSFQTAAREWRYACWQEDMRKEKCTLLATAHHLGDQAETVLYRLLRGSGTAGLAGIYPQKGKLIRPLLTVTKEDILEYCRNEKLPYALDHSNEEPVYVRNKIRLQLLPELQREYNPKIIEALGRTAEVLRWDEDYLEEEVQSAWKRWAILDTEQRVGLRRTIFELPKAILSRLIRRAATLVSGEPRGIAFQYVEQVMASQGQVGWSQDLPGLNIGIDYQGVWFQRADWGQSINESPDILLPSLPVGAHWGEWLPWRDEAGVNWLVGLFCLEKEAEDNDYPGQCVDKVFFDGPGLIRNSEKLQWRYRQDGDCLWLAGLGHKSLKKVFQDAKVPAKHRPVIPLLAMGNEILWIPGVKRGDRYPLEQGKGAVGVLIKC